MKDFPLTIKEVALWFFGQRCHFKVDGNSMIPVIQHNQHVFMKKNKKFAVGDIVITKDTTRLLIKKIYSLNKSECYLVGFNRDESQELSVNISELMGKVTAVF